MEFILLTVVALVVVMFVWAKSARRPPYEEALGQLASGNTIRAEMMANDLLRRAERAHGEDSADAARARLVLGRVLAAGEDRDEAKETLRKALGKTDGIDPGEVEAASLALGRLLLQDAMNHQRAKRANPAKAAYLEAKPLVRSNEGMARFVDLELGRIQSRQPPAWPDRERDLSRALTAALQAATSAELVRGTRITLDVDRVEFALDITRDATEEEARAINAATSAFVNAQSA